MGLTIVKGLQSEIYVPVTPPPVWAPVTKALKDMSIAIASAAGISAREMAIRFCIPQRTMENWCMGVNKCPLYTRLTLQESLGIYAPNVDPM